MAKFIFRVERKSWLELEVEADTLEDATAYYDDCIADDFEVVANDWMLEEVEEVA